MPWLVLGLGDRATELPGAVTVSPVEIPQSGILITRGMRRTKGG